VTEVKFKKGQRVRVVVEGYLYDDVPQNATGVMMISSTRNPDRSYGLDGNTQWLYYPNEITSIEAVRPEVEPGQVWTTKDGNFYVVVRAGTSSSKWVRRFVHETSGALTTFGAGMFFSAYPDAELIWTPPESSS
jgi:hypothetical protein